MLDTECYRNYYLAKFRNVETKATREFACYAGQIFDWKAIWQILKHRQIVTFNGNNYDLPMLTYAMLLAKRGYEPLEMCEQLKRASDWIILQNMKGWEFEREWDVEVPREIDHIDLIEVAFGQGSLKLYGGRLHSKRLQDLPIEPDAEISPEQRVVLSDYCGNDLDTTIDLYNHLKPALELRTLMSAGYKTDLRSKSDAQIAEAVIRKEVSALLGAPVYRPEIPAGTRFKYRPPEFLAFKSPELQTLLREIADADFIVGANGSPIEPKVLDGREVRINQGVYRMGIGGLHSSETCAAHVADDEHILLDRDVASYYPSIVLQCKLFPQHLTDAFLKVYKSVFDRRIKAKRSGQKTEADTLKIVLNGAFGKLGSFYSVLYSPDLLIQVTLTGQLALLMFIEALEDAGISVVSANTDGIVIYAHVSQKEELDRIVKWWESVTGFETEETLYRAIYSRDVNNYIALKAGGGTKGKGAFAPVSISKNPQNAICNEAVLAYLDKGVHIAQTILECRDIRKFLTVRTVRGGAIRILSGYHDAGLTQREKRAALLNAGWIETYSKHFVPEPNGHTPLHIHDAYRVLCGEIVWEPVGKVVRWYVARGVTDSLHYKVPNSNGTHNKVPGSDGARPLMELPEFFPDDVDYEFYIAEAHSILKDIGAL